MRGKAYCLSRHDVTADGSLVFPANIAPISQDSWIFLAPLPFVDCDFQLGKPGCDNRIAFEFQRAGLRVSNPCLSIVCKHLHASAIRNYVHGADTIIGQYLPVPPTSSL
eukprot:gnl/Spiro4/12637_TR6682_c0_g2_i1.p3 gnl/Spiro4/12637_TR6682_c0_g2~~gnl/Spiro4/12637_TR6682_c0_g2_i1.p3  ORF type:complete len:109 (+),score=0.73 gnl/Spiro4/12637_TR6682_c0_g2_i1:617-943(+)